MGMQITAAGKVPQELSQESLKRGLFHSAGTASLQKPALPEKNEKAGEAAIEALTSDIETVSKVFNKRLRFIVDYQSHNVTVNVIDTATDKVIKVLPPEELQRLHDRMTDTLGVLFNKLV